MIQRADHVYRARLFIKAGHEGGLWHRHLQGVEPFVPQGVDLTTTVVPRIYQGAWIIDCPHCHSAQYASPEGPGADRFFCIDCLNVAYGRQWLQVRWPPPDQIAAGEAAVDAREDFATRNWNPAEETIGALLAENVMFGQLFDSETGEVAGDIGAARNQVTLPSGPRTIAELD
jgi:hypothetical protein